MSKLRNSAGPVAVLIAVVVVLGLLSREVVHRQSPQQCMHAAVLVTVEVEEGVDTDIRGYCRNEQAALMSQAHQNSYLDRMESARTEREVVEFFCRLLEEPDYRPTFEELQQLVNDQIPRLGVSGLSLETCNPPVSV